MTTIVAETANPAYKKDVLGTTIAQRVRRQMGILEYLNTFSKLSPDHHVKITNERDGICNSCAIGNHCDVVSSHISLQDQDGNSVPLRKAGDLIALNTFYWMTKRLIREGIVPQDCLEYDTDEVPGLSSGPKQLAIAYSSYNTGYFPYIPPLTTTSAVVKEVLQRTDAF